MSEPQERAFETPFRLYYDVDVPESRSGALPLLVAMHGYGGDKKSMLRSARKIVGDDFVVASLQGPHQHIVRPDESTSPLGYGFGWLTNFKSDESLALHHAAVDHIVHSLASEGAVDRDRVFLLGFSQAVGLNFRYAFTRMGRVRGVVAICGGIPGDWASEGKYESGDLDVLFVAGEQDEFYGPDRMRANAAAIAQRARTVDLKVYPCGHVVPREARPDIADWLRARI